MTKRVCPTPKKVAYRDRATAVRWARGGRVYLCPCGRLHVSTKPKPARHAHRSAS